MADEYVVLGIGAVCGAVLLGIVGWLIGLFPFVSQGLSTGLGALAGLPLGFFVTLALCRRYLTSADHALVAKDRRTETGFRMTLTDTRRAIDDPVVLHLG